MGNIVDWVQATDGNTTGYDIQLANDPGTGSQPSDGAFSTIDSTVGVSSVDYNDSDGSATDWYRVRGTGTAGDGNWSTPARDYVVSDTCNVFGYLADITGDMESGIEVSVKLSVEDGVKGNVNIARMNTDTVTTNSSGYWNINLIPNADIETGSYYQFTFEGKKVDIYKRVVPDSASAAFSSLEAPA